MGERWGERERDIGGDRDRETESHTSITRRGEKPKDREGKAEKRGAKRKRKHKDGGELWKDQSNREKGRKETQRTETERHGWRERKAK